VRPAASTPVRRVYDVATRGWVDTRIVPWESLTANAQVWGPAIVEHPTTTVYAATGQQVSVDRVGNLLITLQPRPEESSP
jgi:N-methylhydantoinase A